MKTITGFRVIVCWMCVISCLPVLGQEVLMLKTGTFPLQKPLVRSVTPDQPAYYFFTPGHVITEQEGIELQRSGIDMLYALQHHIYWVRVSTTLPQHLEDNMFEADHAYKSGIDPEKRNAGNRWRLSIAPGLENDLIVAWSALHNIRLLDTLAATYGIIDIEAEPSQFDDVLRTPWVAFLEEIPVDEEINYRMFDAERGWELVSPQTRGLSGEGITVGIGDGGRLASHQDISEDVLDLTSFSVSAHATQVTGVVTGSGTFEPLFGRGYAPDANVLVRNFSDILWASPQYIQDFNLSLTNNSYGTGPDNCVFMGDYTGTSTALDAMMWEYPELLHVFASGNSGGLTCSPHTFRFGTIQGGYQVSKNVLTVGAIQANDIIAPFSSRGPVDDGRIKPEVVAQGAGRFSTIDNNAYTSNSGTSFSSPAVTGLAALISERYKQLHQDSLPEANFLKNLICNGADEIGNTGPDFIYGYGRINGVRSIEIMEANRYQSWLLSHGQEVVRNIQIPANAASADIMLSWSDYPSAPFETVALVNDLDMFVITPSGDTIRPWILNPAPSGVNTNAVRGIDRLNTIEQITIENAVQGNYTVIIKGYHIPMGPQKAWLTWDVHLSGITVRSPNAGEIFRPGNPAFGFDRHYVRWDAYGTGNATFTAEYSTDDGNNWTLIANNIPSVRRFQEWFLPNVHTDKLKVRVNATNGMSGISSLPSSIMAPPANLLVTSPCQGYVNVSWSEVTAASKYYVYSLRGETLALLDSTTSTSILLSGFHPQHQGWITVAGVFPSGKTGMRARAVAVNANGGLTCSWDHDLRIESLTSPATGRQFTNTALSVDEEITVSIANAGVNNATGFQLSYQVNDGSVITEPFPGNLDSGMNMPFTFSQGHDFSSAGQYELKVWITYAADPFKKNDTLRNTINQLANNPVMLPWVEGFESFPDLLVDTTTMGLPSADGWDVEMTPGARLRTFAGSTFCRGGYRALTIDTKRNGTETGFTTLTLNLDAYNVTQHDIRLSVFYMHHHIFPDAQDETIEVRGSDAMPFVTLATLEDEASTRGVWQQLSGMEISDALLAAGQNYSSSFQVRFPFSVNATAGSSVSQDGQTFDDLTLELVGHDLKIDSLVLPAAISCGLGNEIINVSITNTTNKPVTQVTLNYRVNNGTTFSTNAGTIAANANAIIALDQPFDFSLPGAYDIEVWLSAPGDLFHHNDTLLTMVLHSALVNTFPYREGFETGDGNWLTAGVQNSWMHGMPSKEILSHAAEGDNAWLTGLTADYNADELSCLYSPCFDLTGISNPYLSFAFKRQLETDFDFAWVEYRTGDSETWIKLGAQGSGTHWYNHNSHTWTGTQSKWITTGISIPVTNTIVQLRWVIQTDVGVELEGIAVDQVNVYDLQPISNGAPDQWMLPVTGNDWVHIDDGAQRVFSIHPKGQDLGTVTLTLFQSGANVINGDSLYLLKRHWVLSSTVPPSSEILLRGYFTNSEADQLVAANSCSQCLQSRDAFDVCVLRYSGVNEDANYDNNVPSGVRSYHQDSTEIFPYENGYYAEWQSDGLSEWWITSPVTKYKGTVIRRIGQWSDDAEENVYTGSVNPLRDTLTLTMKDGHQYIGWRFKNITIPKDAYITSAKISLTANQTDQNAASWFLLSEISADAETFITSPYHISLRPGSDVITNWTPGSWTADVEYDSPEIRHLVQRVIDQPGWVTGQDMAILLIGEGVRNAWSFDGDPLKAAKLTISYDTECMDAGICYVRHDANGYQDGTSWTNAFRTLEQALEKKMDCPGITEVWISGGTYKPYAEVDRTDHFMVPEGLNIYGGFAGNEASVAERIPGMYPTIISGEIGDPGEADNSYHVITVLPGIQPVLLDGVTITAGHANGPMPDDQKGGGLLNKGKLICRDVTLLNNSLPAIYNASGAMLEASGLVEIRE